MVITGIETGGRPNLPPFPTSVYPIWNVTLQPLPAIPPFQNTSWYVNQSTWTQTLTIPITTYETTILTSTVTSIPVASSFVWTSSAFLNTTYTANGSTVTSSFATSSVINTTVTVLSQTTLGGSVTSTATIATTLTVSGAPTVIPTPPSTCILPGGCSGQDIFLPIALGQPPTNIEAQGGHPVQPLGIDNTTGPIETNKFYANFFLGSQSMPSFTMPYSLSWSQGSGNAQSWGMAVSHVDPSQRVDGPVNQEIPGTPISYYINPLGLQSLILSAAELGTSTVLTSDSLLEFSANIHLSPQAGSSSSITFPLTKGMAFVTGLYTNLQPAIQSSIFFTNVANAGSPKAGVFKYRASLQDGTTWLLYAMPSNGIDPNFQLTSSTLLQGLPGFSGTIQVAKSPSNSSDAESLYDTAAGAYPTTGSVSGYANGNTAQYSLGWNKGGPFSDNTTLLMFALPHHLQSFDNNTQIQITDLQLPTTTNGMATAVVGDYWILEETDLPTDMGFAPWRPDNNGNVTTLSSDTIAFIQSISAAEASQDMTTQCVSNSMYYSGKCLSKFASIIYSMNDLLQQQGLAAAAIAQLQAAFEVFVNNQQPYPLLYDTVWKGVVSSASYVTGDSGVDFGNSYYNDHHFHYGYFLHAAAVIGYLDPSWLAVNKDYVNALARDVSNPSSQDQYFPVFRSFDWYHGHSWAKGLFESADGKDEESSSEDTMFAYGLKMWGQTIGDASMEARGNLMLAVLARSLQSYFLLESDNANQPSDFIGNKVTGILFENKVDHTTYFGTNLEYIQGIHMLPLMPFSTLSRTQQFVAEEWSTYFASGAVDDANNVAGGWRGILFANYAIINPTASYQFFSQTNFDPSWLDGGASLTWYLVWSGMLGGAPSD